MAIPGFQELFESRIKTFFLNVRHDSYGATVAKTILFPFTQADVGFRYIFAFKNRYLDHVDCYATHTFYSPYHSGVNGLLYNESNLVIIREI